jgi:CRP/FNR family transcriptional regulator, anaerobic regulatory protein
MKDLLLFLHNIHPLSLALQQFLSAKLRITAIHKKQYLLQAGQISRRLYFVKKGLFRCYYLQEDQEITNRFFKEGDIIVAPASFFLQQQSRESIQAIEEGSLLSICFDELNEGYKLFPELNIIARVLTTKSYLHCEKKFSLLRIKQAVARYQFIIDNYPDLILRVPAKYIASYLAVSEETLSRIRSRKY